MFRKGASSIDVIIHKEGAAAAERRVRAPRRREPSAAALLRATEAWASAQRSNLRQLNVLWRASRPRVVGQPHVERIEGGNPRRRIRATVEAPHCRRAEVRLAIHAFEPKVRWPRSAAPHPMQSSLRPDVNLADETACRDDRGYHVRAHQAKASTTGKEDVLRVQLRVCSWEDVQTVPCIL